ncbi:MAG: DUF72 domain-containing protein [Planctomycetota bacterium]
MLKIGNRQIYLGTIGWTYQDWDGSFYPDDLDSKKYLSYYSQFFDSVEVEETFFGCPFPEKLLQWYQQTPAHFLFSLKLSRQITHQRRFKDCQSLFLKFCETALTLKEKLGVVLIQLPNNFQQKHIADLLVLLDQNKPTSFKIAIEFSNRLWKKTEAPAFLKSKNISVVQTDQSPVEDPGSDFLYFRWKGTQEYKHFRVEQRNCQEDLKIWKLKLNQFSGRIRTIYGYFSNHYSGYAPNNCFSFAHLLSSEKNN